MDEPRSDPTERLAFHLGVTPALLAAKFKDLGLRVVDIDAARPYDDPATKAAGKDFERRIRESAAG